jgi:hypothetical protein
MNTANSTSNDVHSNNEGFGSAGIIYCFSVVGFCLFNAFIVLFYKICVIPFFNKRNVRNNVNNNRNDDNTNNNNNTNNNISTIQITNLNDESNKPPSYQAASDVIVHNEIVNNGASCSNEIEKLPSYDEIKLKMTQNFNEENIA